MDESDLDQYTDLSNYLILQFTKFYGNQLINKLEDGSIENLVDKNFEILKRIIIQSCHRPFQKRENNKELSNKNFESTSTTQHIIDLNNWNFAYASHAQVHHGNSKTKFGEKCGIKVCGVVKYKGIFIKFFFFHLFKKKNTNRRFLARCRRNQ